jgi:hypothetical protein
MIILVQMADPSVRIKTHVKVCQRNIDLDANLGISSQVVLLLTL